MPIFTRPALLVALLMAVAIAEAIGPQRFSIGGLPLTLLPMIFAFGMGVLMNPHVMKPMRRLLSTRDTETAGRAVGIAVMPLIVLLSIQIGPQISEVSSAGLALVLQEIGNLGTMLFAMPAAVLLFGMGREAIGATFSIGREGGLAFIYSKYGGESAEAAGVMGVYIAGTFLGAIFFSLMPPLVAATGWFDAKALAMACGIGSASMTAACTTALAAWSPADAQTIAAFAAASNLLTGLTGLFVTIFITIPLAEAYFRGLTRLRARFAR